MTSYKKYKIFFIGSLLIISEITDMVYFLCKRNGSVGNENKLDIRGQAGHFLLFR